MSGERVYVIGERGVGVLLIRTNPLRVVEINEEEIAKYSAVTGGDGYAKIAASLWRLVCDIRDGAEGATDPGKAAGIESLVQSGVQLTDVAFAFSARANAGVNPQAMATQAMTAQAMTAQAMTAQAMVTEAMSTQATSTDEAMAQAMSQQVTASAMATQAMATQAMATHAMATSAMSTNAMAYSPIEDALRQLVEPANDGLRSAVLSDDADK